MALLKVRLSWVSRHRHAWCGSNLSCRPNTAKLIAKTCLHCLSTIYRPNECFHEVTKVVSKYSQVTEVSIGLDADLERQQRLYLLTVMATVNK